MPCLANMICALAFTVPSLPTPVVDWAGGSFDGHSAVEVDPSPVSGLATGTIAIWFRSGEPTTRIQPLLYLGGAEGGPRNEYVLIETGHNSNREGLYFTVTPERPTADWNSPTVCFDTVDPVDPGWHCFVAVVGPGFNTGYLDGEALTSRRYNFGDASERQFLADVDIETGWIGGGFFAINSEFHYFEGEIPRVAIWDAPLASDDIAILPEPAAWLACLMAAPLAGRRRSARGTPSRVEIHSP